MPEYWVESWYTPQGSEELAIAMAHRTNMDYGEMGRICSWLEKPNREVRIQRIEAQRDEVSTDK